MSVKGNIFNKMPLALIFVLVVSVIWPNSAQATTDDNQDCFSTSHYTPSFVFAQEVGEDERADQEVQFLEIVSDSRHSTNKVSHSIVFAQQAESLFFCYLFSNIATQAP